MKRILIMNLTKEYLKLVLMQYSLAVCVWVLLAFTGSGFDWALIGAVAGSLALVVHGWKVIFVDAAKGRCSGLYQGLPVSEEEQRAARVLAAAAGMMIVLAGFAVMTILIWSRIQFWGAQYVYRDGGWSSRLYTEWLYELYLNGGGTL